MSEPHFPIIKKLGGVRATFEILRPLLKTDEAIRMWRKRGSIPGEAMRRMMAAAEKKRIRYSAADFTLTRGAESNGEDRSI